MSKGRWAGRIAAAGTALALLGGGCGTADDERSDRSEREVARAALLRTSDLPSGWTRAPEHDGERPDSRQLSRLCPDYPPDVMAIGSDGDVSFEDGAGRTIGHSVSLMRDSTTAREMVEDAASDRAARCMRAIMRQMLESAPGLESVELGRIAVAPLETGSSGLTRALRIRVPLNGPEGMRVAVNADAVVSHVGRATSTVLAMGVDARVDERLRDALGERAVERLERALDGD